MTDTTTLPESATLITGANREKVARLLARPVASRIARQLRPEDVLRVLKLQEAARDAKQSLDLCLADLIH